MLEPQAVAVFRLVDSPADVEDRYQFMLQAEMRTSDTTSLLTTITTGGFSQSLMATLSAAAFAPDVTPLSLAGASISKNMVDGTAAGITEEGVEEGVELATPSATQLATDISDTAGSESALPAATAAASSSAPLQEHAVPSSSLLSTNGTPLPPPTTISEILARRAAERAAAEAAAAGAVTGALIAAVAADTCACSHELARTGVSHAAARAKKKAKPKSGEQKGARSSGTAGERTVRFHSTAKRANSKHPRSTLMSGGPNGGGMGINLDIKGETHRAYSNARNAVVNRAKPDGPPAEVLDKEKWEAEQTALTGVMMAAYGQAGGNGKSRGSKSKRTARGYVPKPRKTQRAKQKSRQIQNPSIMLYRTSVDT